jgi:hypothetical protein
MSPAIPSPSPIPNRSPSVRVFGQGTLVPEGNGTAYDRYAVNTSWKPLTSQPWLSQNIIYAPIRNNGAPNHRHHQIAAHRRFTDRNRPVGIPGLRQRLLRCEPIHGGPNAVTGASLHAGESVCVETQDASAKSGGDHLVLLVIKSVTSTTVTTVTVTMGAR